MIDNELKFETVCDMILGEMARTAKFGYIKLTPEQREEALQSLTEEERAFYDKMERYSGRGPAYQQAFLGIKYILNNMPDEPGFDESPEKTAGLSLNDLYNITVPSVNGKKILGKNQFDGMLNRPAGIVNSLRGMIKWGPDGYIAGNAEVSDSPVVTPTSPMGLLKRKMGDEMPKHITDTEKIDSPAMSGADEAGDEGEDAGEVLGRDSDEGPDRPYRDPAKPLTRMGIPPSLEDEDEDITPASDRPETEDIPVPDDEEAILSGDAEDIEDDADIILGNSKKKKRRHGYSSVEDNLDDNSLGLDPDVDAAFREFERSSEYGDY